MANPSDSLQWYHGKINRDVAVKILEQQNRSRRQGAYLVRDCNSAPGDYVLSLWHGDQVMHFQVHCLNDNRFAIDDGPSFQGLDSLLAHYKANADGLPCKLTFSCKGTIPPLQALRYGADTKLHKACLESNSAQVRKILSEASASLLISARNSTGSTPLHISSAKGDDEIVIMLLKARGDANALDANGQSSLRLACMAGHALAVKALISSGHADIHERSPMSGMVPLHEAAMRGHVEVVKNLLSFHASMNPRTVDGDTPRDLALRFGHTSVVDFLDNYPVSSPKTSPLQWLHQDLNRNSAIALLQMGGSDSGKFLVRNNVHCHGYYVLSVLADAVVRHFQIRSRADRWFYIDDGPLFETLPHLIDHYMTHSDGLPVPLTIPVPPIAPPPRREMPLPPRPAIKSVPAPVRPLKLPLTPASRKGKDPADISSDRGANSDDEIDYDKMKQANGHQVSPALPPHEPSTIARPPAPLPEIPMAEKPVLAPVRGNSSLQQTMISRESLELGQELGMGEFGSVLRGFWINPDGEKIPVALKTLHQEKMQQGEKEFLREARVMSQLNHPCIVRLLGVCLGPPMILVQELVPMGALLDYLIDYQPQIHEVDLKSWAAQIAWGMMYLEQKRFVHRDLATRNILLASREQVKISDFGLSRAVGAGSDYYQAQQGGRWPVKWYAPESVNYGTFSQKSDVWSYGVTLWEMFTFGELPYGEMTGAEVIALLERGQRLDKPDGCPEHTYQIMLRCWHIEPTQRPTFKELHTIFSTDPEYEDARKYRDRIKR